MVQKDCFTSGFGRNFPTRGYLANDEAHHRATGTGDA